MDEGAGASFKEVPEALHLWRDTPGAVASQISLHFVKF